jgi:1,2-diacylglycerol 3-alpha-glucosyltransferase
VQPIVLISSYPPRLCGIGTFCEEAREFIQARHPERPVLVVSHKDGAGDGVIPTIDVSAPDWWLPVVSEVARLDPYVVHIEHEYGLYEYRDDSGRGDHNQGFIELLRALAPWPVVVEPHTVHGRLCDFEARFIQQMAEDSEVVLFKARYQRWRLDWNFASRGWAAPMNIMVVPHGARDDRAWPLEQVQGLKEELGFTEVPHMGDHYVGLVGWIQRNKRWDILISMWEELAAEILERTGERWSLLAAGEMRDPSDRDEYMKYRAQLEQLERKGLAHFYEFIPRGDIYYKVMAVCDFVVLPTIDETQSGTLARIIALNKPYVTTAPMEGLTSQTLESNGGLLFCTKPMLKERILQLASDEGLRMELGNNLRRYLNEVVSWRVVANQYAEAYELAREAIRTGQKPMIAAEF